MVGSIPVGMLTSEPFATAGLPTAFGSPGFVMTPLGRIGKHIEVAYGVLFLASDEASFVTGAELVIDGGFIAQ
jgi:NAD(P)-dependent dehydrogenase (short-subunit alcohol dehydrogenase family)